jgi:hypothetical protein
MGGGGAATPWVWLTKVRIAPKRLNPTAAPGTTTRLSVTIAIDFPPVVPAPHNAVTFSTKTNEVWQV